MGDRTGIEWSDATLNIWWGCTKVSAGCRDCYAERWSARHRRDFSKITYQWHHLKHPYSWRKPRRIFVNSMSDTFHEAIPDAAIDRVFQMIEEVERHTFMVLTKRPERMQDYLLRRYWRPQTKQASLAPANLWVGTSVENNRVLDRIGWLRQCPAWRRFISFEPLLETLDYEALKQLVGFDDIHLAIVGGESGNRARTMQADWVEPIWKLCMREGICFFFKQWGGRTPKANGRMYRDRYWNEMPTAVEPSGLPRNHGLMRLQMALAAETAAARDVRNA